MFILWTRSTWRKRVNETGILLTKIYIAHFTLVKLEILIANFCYLEIDWRWESLLKKVLRLLISFRWYVKGMSLKLLDHSRRYCCGNSSEKLQKGFIIIIGIKSYLLKKQLQMQSTETLFVYAYEIIIKCYPNFITCLYFPLSLIRWNSTHYHLLYLMGLFRSKESFNEKVYLNNFWKTAWPRMI